MKNEVARLERLLAESARRIAVLERERADLRDETERLRDRARLIERTREELVVVNERLELLGRVTHEVSSLSPDQIFETATTKIPYILGARVASIYLYEPDARRLHLKKHTHGRPIDRLIELDARPDSLMARVIAKGTPCIFEDLEAAAGSLPLDLAGGALERPYRDRYETRSCIVAPLRAGERILGVLNLADRADGGPFRLERDGPLLEQIAALLAIALRNVSLFEAVQAQARLDSLTRLANHRAFFDALAREISRAERYGGDLALLLLDVDRFRSLNDSHGPIAGDFVLEEIGRLLRTSLRAVDLAGRYGADEFGVLLPETDVRGAAIVAERLRQRISEQRFPFAGAEIPVRVSVGMAGYRRGIGVSELMQAAHAALERARVDGGDRVGVAA